MLHVLNGNLSEFTPGKSSAKNLPISMLPQVPGYISSISRGSREIKFGSVMRSQHFSLQPY